MKILCLPSGHKVKLDNADYKQLLGESWHINNCGHGKFYAVQRKTIDGKKKTYLLHRLLTNAPKGMSVDHINGDTLDNQRKNLRICTHAENLRNRKLNKDNKSGYKGVYFRKDQNCWRVEIKLNGIKRSKSGYKTPQEAAKTYNLLAHELFGRFAKLNQL